MERKHVVRWRRFGGTWHYWGAGGVGVYVLGEAAPMERERAELALAELESAARTNGRYLIAEIVTQDDARAEARCQ